MTGSAPYPARKTEEVARAPERGLGPTTALGLAPDGLGGDDWVDNGEVEEAYALRARVLHTLIAVGYNRRRSAPIQHYCRFGRECHRHSHPH